MNKKQLNQNVVLFTESTPKFKEVTFVFRYLFPLEERKNTCASLIANMIQDRSIAYPTKKEMDYTTDMLYGTTLSARTASVGKTLMLEVRSRCIDGKYIDKDLIKEQLDFLAKVIETPLINEETLKEAKRILNDSLARDIEKPARYAIKEAMETGYPGQPISIFARGSQKDIAAITLEECTDFHQWILDCARIEVSCVGDVDETKLIAQLRESFHFYDREISLDFSYFAQKSGPRIVERTQDISQSTLVKFAALPVAPNKKAFTALRIANCMFGEIPSSMLFQEVREKRSLCYSIYSSLLPYDGLMLVVTSLEDKHVLSTNDLVDQLLSTFQKEAFDDHLFASAKETLYNRYRVIADDPYAIIDYQLRNNCIGLQQSLDDMIAQISEITPEDVQEVLQKVFFSFNFQLRTKEETNG